MNHNLGILETSLNNHLTKIAETALNSNPQVKQFWKITFQILYN